MDRDFTVGFTLTGAINLISSHGKELLSAQKKKAVRYLLCARQQKDIVSDDLVNRQWRI